MFKTTAGTYDNYFKITMHINMNYEFVSSGFDFELADIIILLCYLCAREVMDVDRPQFPSSSTTPYGKKCTVIRIGIKSMSDLANRLYFSGSAKESLNESATNINPRLGFSLCRCTLSLMLTHYISLRWLYVPVGTLSGTMFNR